MHVSHSMCMHQPLHAANVRADPIVDHAIMPVQVDTHVHHSACMHQKHLLRFIKSKLRKEPGEVVIFRDGKYLTLQEVFESLKLTGYVTLRLLRVGTQVIRIQKSGLDPKSLCCRLWAFKSWHFGFAGGL